MPHRSDFGAPCCLRPPVAGSALGAHSFSRPLSRSLSLRPGDSSISPRETLSIGFRVLVSRHPAIQTTGLLTLAPAGLSPAEHASLRWTHNRTCRFPASGSPTGFTARHTTGPLGAGVRGAERRVLHRRHRQENRLVAAPLHLVPSREEVAHALIDVLVDATVCRSTRAVGRSSSTSQAETCSACRALPAMDRCCRAPADRRPSS